MLSWSEWNIARKSWDGFSNRAQRKKMYQKKYRSRFMKTYDCGTNAECPVINLDCFDTTIPCVGKEETTQNKKGKPMRYYDEERDEYVDAIPTTTEAERTREYLSKRLNTTDRNKQYEALDVFHINDDAAPGTINELVARLAAGKFTFPKGYEDKPIYDPIQYIRWRDPAVPKDEAGHSAFVAKLELAHTAAKDTIKVMDPAAGLAALREFEAIPVA